MAKNIFAVKVDGQVKHLKVNQAKVNIPGFGVLTAEELANNAPAITLVMKNPIFQGILSEVSEAEVKEVTEAEAKAAAEAEAIAKAAALESEKAEYEKAKAIVAGYEAKYAEKKSTKK